MKLVRAPTAPVLEALRALQSGFCRLQGPDLEARTLERNRQMLVLAHSRLSDSVERTLAAAPTEEAARLRGQIDGSLLLHGYDLAASQAGPLDAPLDLAELFDLWEEMQAGLSRWGQEFDHHDLDVVVATALHRSHNARTFCLDPRGPHIILFHDRLLDLLNELAALAVTTLPPDASCYRLVAGRRELVTPAGPLAPAQHRRFNALARNLMRRHALQQWDIPGWRLTKIDDPRGDLAFDLYQGMKFFVMGHELAHIVLRHNTWGQPVKALADEWDEPLRPVLELRRRRLEELEADAVGMHLGMLSAAANALSLPLYFQAVLLFLNGARWVEAARQSAAGQTGSGPLPPAVAISNQAMADTHPPLADRRAQVRRALRRMSTVRPATEPAHFDRMDRQVRQLALRLTPWQGNTGTAGTARLATEEHRRR